MYGQRALCSPVHHKAEPRQLLANLLGHLVHTGDAASWVSLESTSSLHTHGQTQHCTKKKTNKKHSYGTQWVEFISALQWEQKLAAQIHWLCEVLPSADNEQSACD